MHDYRKPKQAMETRMEKRRGRGRPGRTWEDCVIDAARRKGNTLADLRRLTRDRTAFRQWTEDPTLQGNRDRWRRRRRKHVLHTWGFVAEPSNVTSHISDWRFTRKRGFQMFCALWRHAVWLPAASPHNDTRNSCLERRSESGGIVNLNTKSNLLSTSCFELSLCWKPSKHKTFRKGTQE